MQRFWLAAALLTGLMLGTAVAQDVPPYPSPLLPEMAQGLAPDNFPNLPNKRKRKDRLVPYGQPMLEPPPVMQAAPDGNGTQPPQELGPQVSVPEAVAVSRALRALPGSKPLGVRLLPGTHPVYAVKLRTQGQVQRVLVDAMTGQIVGQ